MLVEDKHSISVLVETVLFPRLRAFDEDPRNNLKEREEKKTEAIKVFVEEYAGKSTLLSEEEVRQIVDDVIARTKRNLKKADGR